MLFRTHLDEHGSCPPLLYFKNGFSKTQTNRLVNPNLFLLFKMSFLLLKYKVLGFMTWLLGTLSFEKGKAMTMVAIWSQNRTVHSNDCNYVIIKDCFKGKTKSLFGRHRRVLRRKAFGHVILGSPQSLPNPQSLLTFKEHRVHVNHPCRRVMNQSDMCLIFLPRSLADPWF